MKPEYVFGVYERLMNHQRVSDAEFSIVGDHINTYYDLLEELGEIKVRMARNIYAMGQILPKILNEPDKKARQAALSGKLSIESLHERYEMMYLVAHTIGKAIINMGEIAYTEVKDKVECGKLDEILKKAEKRFNSLEERVIQNEK